MIPWDEINDAILATLTPREEYVLRKYFGLGCDKVPTVKIGEYFHIGPSGVDHIRKKALKKIEARFGRING